MKYSIRQDRRIRNVIKSTAPYESRASIARRFAVDSFASDFANKLRKGSKFEGIEDKYYNPRHNPAGGELEGIEDKYYSPRHSPAGGELEGVEDEYYNPNYKPTTQYDLSGDDEVDTYYVPDHQSAARPKLSFHWDSTTDVTEFDGFGAEENKTKTRDYILLAAAIILLAMFSKS